MSVLQSTQDGVRTARDGVILEVRLDRPKANAIDLPASRRLNAIFTAFRDDEVLRVAIVSGAGERFFSPGWDLKNAAQGEESDSDWGVGGFAGLNYPRNLDKPIIAAVNGIACGGGFELVLGTDIIVMEEHARFALPEINVGVLPDAGTIKLRRRIPYQPDRARGSHILDLVVTFESFSPLKFYRPGNVERTFMPTFYRDNL